MVKRNTLKTSGQGLCTVSAALDRLFDNPPSPSDGEKIIFETEQDGLTLVAVQNQGGTKVIIGNPRPSVDNAIKH